MNKKDFSQEDIVRLLKGIMDTLNEEQKAYLLKHTTIQKYKKNEGIYYEGESPSMLMCLLSGKVKVFKDGVGGRSQIIRVIKPVDYFGYRAYFEGTKFLTAAAAFEPSVVCMIPMKVIDKLLSESNQLGRFFIIQLSKALGVSDTRTVSLTQKHIRGRLAESLLFLLDCYGLEEDDSTLSIYLSREDLANLSNMTTSNAIRTLSMFANERIIAIDGRKIKIIDEEKLRKISIIG